MRSALVLLLASLSATLAWDFTTSINKFAAFVYKAYSLNTKDNILLSPLSAGTVLAFAKYGAKGETAEELQKLLFLFEDATESEPLLTNLAFDQPYSLHAANKIYVKDDYEIKPDFEKVAQEIFSSEVEAIDFSPREEAAEVINQWVLNKTENRIQNLIDPEMLSNKTRAILLNTLFFKANWSTPFQKLFTFGQDFHLDNESVQVEMMHDFDATYDYHESKELDAKLLRMSFEGENASMTIVLPNRKDGLEVLENRIDIALEVDSFTKELVNVALPRFKIENRVDLKDVFKSLGVKKAFLDGEADFSGIAGNPGDLFVSEVVQKSFLQVDEDGVEAAAATFIIKIFNRNGEIAKEFVANHPFLFYVKVEGLTVFVGRVVSPSI